MFDDRRDLFLALAARVLAAAPFLATTWYLFERTKGDADGGGHRLLGLSCAVAAGIIIARPLAALVAEPTGSLFFPRRATHPEPAYSLADAQRKRGQFEQAIAEYEKIAAQFPAEVRAHVAMMEIAMVDLQDAERARQIAQRGLAGLLDESRRMELLRAYRALVARR